MKEAEVIIPKTPVPIKAAKSPIPSKSLKSPIETRSPKQPMQVVNRLKTQEHGGTSDIELFV